MLKVFLSATQSNQKVISVIGAASGWAAFDLLRAAQVTAAVLASLVSLCALILTGPSAVAKVKGWLTKSQ
jgi:hypothetical protein